LDYMETGIYPTDLDKMALAVESAKLAKQMSVSEEGIGEDININLFCWKNDYLASVVQLSNTHKLERNERVEKITDAACILRKGWGVDEFTFIAEGYCSMKPSQTKNQDLAELYAQKNSPVKECISFTHITQNDATFVSVPYSVGLGKKVDFDTPLCYSGLDVMRDLTYTATLKASLKLKPSEFDERAIDREAYFGTLASSLIENGFEVFYRDDL